MGFYECARVCVSFVTCPMFDVSVARFSRTPRHTHLPYLRNLFPGLETFLGAERCWRRNKEPVKGVSLGREF